MGSSSGLEAVTATTLESIHPVVLNNKLMIFRFCEGCSRLVCIKVSDLPPSKGRVRAAGVVCLIGLGLSLGTLLLYKLYLRIIIPFLRSLRTGKGDNLWLDDDYTLYLDESESEVDNMGNNSSKRSPVPNVYYNRRNSGITVGSRPTSPTTSHSSSNEDLRSASSTTSSAKPEKIRLRPKSAALSSSVRHKSPSPSSDKDSAIGGAGGSEMSQSLYSENSLNRDSFYSTGTTESGFDDLGFLEDLRNSKLTGSLKESYSPNSLRERSLQMLYRAHRGRDPGLNALAGNGLETVSDCDSNHSGILSSCSTRSSCCSCDGTYITKTNVDPLEQKLVGNSLSDVQSGHRRHVTGGEKPGIAFSTPLFDKSQSNPSLNRHNRQSSYSSSSNSKSSPYQPTPHRHNDKLRNSSNSIHSSLRNCSFNSDEFRNRENSPQRHFTTRRGQHSHFSEDHQSFGNTESIHSFNTSEDYDFINWQNEQQEEEMDEGEGEEMNSQMDEGNGNHRRLSALPEHLNQSLSDLHFRQSLMQRIQEWSSFAEEYNKSVNPTPECSPIRFVRRSRSLDRHLSDSSIIATESEIPSSKPLEIEPVTEKNLESLEYELHDIQGEFESITSKLHDLIEQQASTSTPLPLSQAPMSSSYPAAFTTKKSRPSLISQSSNNNNNNLNSHNGATPLSFKESPSSSPRRRFESKSTPCVNSSSDISQHSSLRKMKTKWEKVPGSACSDCSRSSRGSSVEYVWDMADYSPNSTSASADRSRTSPAIGRHVSRNGGMMSTDLCPVDASDCICNINQPVSIQEYCQREWKGDTAKANAIREGYHQIPIRIHCERMCVIRGDNYCALRSSLFQVLVEGIRIVPSSWGIIGIMDRLHDHFEDPTIRMSDWSFASRLPGHCKDKLASISKCALSLYATVEEVCNLPTREEREKRTINLFNASSTFDLELMEGVKVMMLLQLVSLRQRMLDGEDDIPLFGHLLFARDTSESIADFIKNHLNRIGDTSGLEQVEMCLLGYTLGMGIKVLRLSQAGQEDFQCCYPDDMPDNTPQVVLLAEDDRHYNVPLP